MPNNKTYEDRFKFLARTGYYIVDLGFREPDYHVYDGEDCITSGYSAPEGAVDAAIEELEI